MAKAVDILGILTYKLLSLSIFFFLSYFISIFIIFTFCVWYWFIYNEIESKQNIKILPVFVTIDPQRDNPSQLGAYLKGWFFSVVKCWNIDVLIYFYILIIYANVEFDSRIMGLTGSVAAIRQMAQEYRVFFKKVEEDGDDYLVESSHNM